MACITGFTTGGYYEYTDCCGLNQTGLSPGLESVCVDTLYSATTIGLVLDPLSSCTGDCSTGPLSYNFTVTGTCGGGLGSIEFNAFGGVLSYTIDNIIPGSISAQTGNGPFLFTGLTAGTYTFRLNDSQGLQNNELYINTIISNCFNANIINTTGTTCGLNNGSFLVTATTSASPYNIVVYKDDNFYQLINATNFPVQVSNLGEGVYYTTVYDYGSITASTENVIISPSNGVDFGFWKVNTSNCVIDKGKLAVTGVTGNGPFTYLWTPSGETTQMITGLTIGTYTCTVTDALGCSTTKTETIGTTQPMGLTFLTPESPSCFSSDGSLAYTISGGTAPYYYSASTSQIGYTFSDTFVVTGLSSGNYNVVVKDSNLCEIILNGFLSVPNGFNVVGTNVSNPSCGNNNGQISVQINGLSGFYVYSLSGQNTQQVYGNVSQNQNYTFSNLPNDNYLLVVSGTGTDCVYSTSINLDATPKFEITANTTGATCFSSDGILHVDVSTGFTPPLDYILTNTSPIIDTNLSSYTFNNLSVGTYTLEVRDKEGCSVFETINITSVGELSAYVETTPCENGINGQAQVIILEGKPTFTYDWSDNVCCGQTGSTISGLTAGTYSVLVTDMNGCEIKLPFSIFCSTNIITTYSSFNICNDFFETTVNSKRGFEEMLNEGFLDITSGYTGCSFNSAEFICEVTINGSAFTQSFYTATTLNDVPQDSLWQTTIENILYGVSGISSVNINLYNNTLQITSTCDGSYDPFKNAEFSLGLEIIYDVSCFGEPTTPPILCTMSGYTFEINQI
jgi:hypothetical protein